MASHWRHVHGSYSVHLSTRIASIRVSQCGTKNSTTHFSSEVLCTAPNGSRYSSTGRCLFPEYTRLISAASLSPYVQCENSKGGRGQMRWQQFRNSRPNMPDFQNWRLCAIAGNLQWMRFRWQAEPTYYHSHAMMVNSTEFVRNCFPSDGYSLLVAKAAREMKHMSPPELCRTLVLLNCRQEHLRATYPLGQVPKLILRFLVAVVHLRSTSQT